MRVYKALFTLLILALALPMPAHAKDRPANQDIGVYLNQLGIPKDPSLVVKRIR